MWHEIGYQKVFYLNNTFRISEVIRTYKNVTKCEREFEDLQKESQSEVNVL